MKNRLFNGFKLVILCGFFMVLLGCDQLQLTSNKSNAQGNRPDLDCIIANDFYAVHFSTYIQPKKLDKNADAKSTFVPYCQKIPSPGRMFFTADLIDRDIRTTPIGIKLVEVGRFVEKSTESVQELRTVVEVPAKLYPKGAVEAQADVDKNGHYLLYLLIGDAVEEDDRFRIPLEVGVDPNGLSEQIKMILVAVGVVVIVLLGLLIFWLKKRKSK